MKKLLLFLTLIFLSSYVFAQITPNNNIVLELSPVFEEDGNYQISGKLFGTYKVGNEVFNDQLYDVNGILLSGNQGYTLQQQIGQNYVDISPNSIVNSNPAGKIIKKGLLNNADLNVTYIPNSDNISFKNDLNISINTDGNYAVVYKINNFQVYTVNNLNKTVFVKYGSNRSYEYNFFDVPSDYNVLFIPDGNSLLVYIELGFQTAGTKIYIDPTINNSEIGLIPHFSSMINGRFNDTLWTIYQQDNSGNGGKMHFIESIDGGSTWNDDILIGNYIDNNGFTAESQPSTVFDYDSNILYVVFYAVDTEGFLHTILTYVTFDDDRSEISLGNWQYIDLAFSIFPASLTAFSARQTGVTILDGNLWVATTQRDNTFNNDFIYSLYTSDLSTVNQEDSWVNDVNFAEASSNNGSDFVGTMITSGFENDIHILFQFGGTLYYNNWDTVNKVMNVSGFDESIDSGCFSCEKMFMDVNSSNIPFVAYRDQSNQISLVNRANNSWQSPVQLSSDGSPAEKLGSMVKDDGNNFWIAWGSENDGEANYAIWYDVNQTSSGQITFASDDYRIAFFGHPYNNVTDLIAFSVSGSSGTNKYIYLSSFTMLTAPEPDTSPPVTTSDINSGVWQNFDANVHLFAVDDVSVQATYYRLDSDSSNAVSLGVLTLYDSNILFQVDGNFALHYFSQDTSDNNEAVNIEYVLIDQTAPVTSSDVNDSVWQNIDANVHLNCSDALSGCAVIYYQLDGNPSENEVFGDLMVFDENIFLNPSPDGNFTIQWFSSDVADNNEAVNTAYVLFDMGNPSITNTYPTSNIQQSVSDTNLTFIADVSDSRSGLVSDCSYDFYHDSVLIAEDVNVSITDGTCVFEDVNSNTGVYLVAWHVRDIAGNQEDVNSNTIELIILPVSATGGGGSPVIQSINYEVLLEEFSLNNNVLTVKLNLVNNNSFVNNIKGDFNVVSGSEVIFASHFNKNLGGKKSSVEVFSFQVLNPLQQSLTLIVVYELNGERIEKTFNLNETEASQELPVDFWNEKLPFIEVVTVAQASLILVFAGVFKFVGFI